MTSSWLSNLVLLGLRATFFLACRRYVHRSLLSDLNKVIKDDPISTSSSESSSGSESGSHLDLAHQTVDSISTSRPRHEKAKIKQWLTEILRINPTSNQPDLLPLRSASPLRKTSKSTQPSQQHISSTIAVFLFCWAFCEGSLLFSIVILGSWLDPMTRTINWNLSLGLLISSVVFIVPFLECLLFSTSILSQKTNDRVRFLSARTVGLTCLPFAVYLFVYYRVGQTMQGLLGVESGTHSFGFLTTTLARICVPGVFLIASLSGGGAVNTAWETWEWRRREKEPPVTDQHIATAEQSLYRTRMDLAERQSSLQQQLQSTNGTPENTGTGILSLFTGSSNPKVVHLQQEIAGLEAMENQIMSDLNRLKERKEYSQYSRTIPGMLLNIANWSLSVYCVYRLFMACVNLMFGYMKRSVADSRDNVTRNPTTDIVTYVIAKILSTFKVELELTKLTRLVGLVLIGSIIAVNLRAVLVWVHRVFNKVSSRGVSSNLMLLVLGQLMAMYLLTCLISLPASAPEEVVDKNSSWTTDLLCTLPSFHRFSRLFDLVFLLTGILTGLLRWLGKQIGQNVAGGGGADDDRF